MASCKIRKRYKFIGTDSRFKAGEFYDRWQISDISDLGFFAVKNRLLGVDFFDDNFLRPAKPRNTISPVFQTTTEALSAKWLKRRLK